MESDTNTLIQTLTNNYKEKKRLHTKHFHVISSSVISNLTCDKRQTAENKQYCSNTWWEEIVLLIAGFIEVPYITLHNTASGCMAALAIYIQVSFRWFNEHELAG